MFTISAYALDLDESGAVVLREADLLETSDYWGGYRVGDTYYVSMGLRYKGTDIRSVTFTTEEGCFARQQITSDMSEEAVSKLYIGPDNRLIVFGTDFEPLGDSVTLEGSEMDEGTLLFWGVQALSPDDIPKNPRITAQAVFQDGSSETLQVTLDLSGMAVFGGQDDRPSEGPPMAYRQSRYYKSLPLEDCELVDEQTVTDVYQHTVDGYTISHQVPDDALYDESGLYRSRRLRISGNFYLPVFQRDGETCTARLYRVPKELEFSPENEAKAGLGQTGSVPSDTDVSESDYYERVLSLSDCELVENVPVTDRYVYTLGNGQGVIQLHEEMPFEQDGCFRGGWGTTEGETFLFAVCRDETGSLWGRTYRVPENRTYAAWAAAQ